MAELVEVVPIFAPHVERMRVKNQDPNYHYRWVAMNQDRVDFMKEIGYELVEDTETGDKKVVQNSILMRCPKEQFEKRQGQRRYLNIQRMQSPRSKVKDTAEALGVEATDKTRESRGPMSSVMQEGPSKEEAQEGVVTREQVETVFNPRNQE